MDTYAHLYPGQSEEAMNRLDSRYREARAAQYTARMRWPVFANGFANKKPILLTLYAMPLDLTRFNEVQHTESVRLLKSHTRLNAVYLSNGLLNRRRPLNSTGGSNPPSPPFILLIKYLQARPNSKLELCVVG